jgi:hypothetical protein
MNRLGACMLALLLTGCAPDAWGPAKPFDAWLARVKNACNYAKIGGYEVGQLLGINASDRAMVFVDATSRLYYGAIGSDQWTESVVTELNGRASDAGVGCVLAQLASK